MQPSGYHTTIQELSVDQKPDKEKTYPHWFVDNSENLNRIARYID